MFLYGGTMPEHWVNSILVPEKHIAFGSRDCELIWKRVFADATEEAETQYPALEQCLKASVLIKARKRRR